MMPIKIVQTNQDTYQLYCSELLLFATKSEGELWDLTETTFSRLSLRKVRILCIWEGK